MKYHLEGALGRCRRNPLPSEARAHATPAPAAATPTCPLCPWVRLLWVVRANGVTQQAAFWVRLPSCLWLGSDPVSGRVSSAVRPSGVDGSRCHVSTM